ncbi:BZ3500_MvSof-1268-A1-R1_Chr9g10313 [Microbotryum saponariae]|uniref:threonine ammonia-lyase n=1 Tax=Microbotryum saponariae TaxID=289078 RepID=A0A2X0LLJ4_9BASI|nr:BZ3500_MvSof-1268-A1-R1_Chr9g10313 [Microbotryum saponariae]
MSRQSTFPSPTVSGLIAETEGTVPPLSNGRARTPARRRSSGSLDSAAAVDPKKTIRLPGGVTVTRPVFEPNKSLYKRVPPHLLLPDGTPNYLPLCLTSNVYSILPPSGTPLTVAPALSARLGNQVLFKREDLTPVFSFKLRGAYNLMKQLSSDERWRGVVACSAGNHAQGVALSGRELGIACTIVMPLNTPSIKYMNVDRLGAKVVLHGADFDEAKKECDRLAKVHGLTIIPPFDDPYIIAGQGTAAVEILRQTDVNQLDAVFVPVGGGGFLAGIASYIKAVAPPHVKVIGVETYDADCLAQTLKAGQRLMLHEVGLFADGTAVRQMGEESVRVCAALVDEIILVSNDELCAAIKDIFEGQVFGHAKRSRRFLTDVLVHERWGLDTRSAPEPSGALGVAGMKKYILQNNLLGQDKCFVPIVSGANLNFSRLRFIADRAELGEGKEAMMRVIIPETPGAFLQLHSVIHPRAVTEFVYRYSSPTRAFIFLSFYLSSASSSANNNTTQPVPSINGTSTVRPLTPAERRAQELQSLIATFKTHQMNALDISDNEMAKNHARYLVGGRSKVNDERVFRFEFPERPGALRKFLETMGTGFNISLFHYRNHGGDVGKILAGIQVAQQDEPKFQEWLHGLRYPYVEETDNPVYKDFLDEVHAEDE